MDRDYKLAFAGAPTSTSVLTVAEYLVLVEVLHDGTIQGQYVPLPVSPVDVKAHVVRDDFS